MNNTISIVDNENGITATVNGQRIRNILSYNVFASSNQKQVVELKFEVLTASLSRTKQTKQSADNKPT